MVAAPLHVHRQRGRPGVRLVVADPVPAAARPAVPGPGQRWRRRRRLPARGVRRVAGPLHAGQGQQPPGPALGLAGAAGGRPRQPGGDGVLLPGLAERRARPDGCSASALVQLSPGRGAGVDRDVRARGARPAVPQVGAVSGPPARAGGAAAGFRGGGRRPGPRPDRGSAQRCGRPRRDGLAQQHLRRGQRRGLARLPDPDDDVAVRRPRVAGVVGVAGAPGTDLRRRRADGGGADRVQRCARDRADPRLRGQRRRRRHPRDRTDRRPGVTAHRWARPRGRRRGHHHRHRLDQRGRGFGAGVHVQRRHRNRVDAVLVPAELDLVPRRQGERPPGRSGPVRGGGRTRPCQARGGPAQAGGVRREPGFLRRRGAVPEPGQPGRQDRRGAVLGADVQQHHLDRPHRQPRPRITDVAPDLRQG